MSNALHTPIDLLAGQDRLKFLLLAKLHCPAVADVYHKVYDKPEQPNFLDNHPMARANHMMGEFDACIHLLHGILYPERDAFHNQTMSFKFQAINALFAKLSSSLEYEVTKVDSKIRNYCENPAEWAQVLEEMHTRLNTLENYTNNKTLDHDPADNALLHNYLENTLYDRMFHLIGEIQRDVNQWNADVVQILPITDDDRSKRRFRATDSTIAAAIADPENNPTLSQLFPQKQR